MRKTSGLIILLLLSLMLQKAEVRAGEDVPPPAEGTVIPAVGEEIAPFVEEPFLPQEKPQAVPAAADSSDSADAVVPAPAQAAPAENDSGARGYVKRMYTVVLGREADRSGLAYWTNALESRELTASDIVISFFKSKEYQSSNKTNEAVVRDFYSAMLNRNPDQGGLAYWKGRLDAGMSFYTIAAGFVGSTEFGNICNTYGIDPGKVTSPYARDDNYERTAFVSRLYRNCLGRDSDESGLDYWCGRIRDGANASTIASGFVFSDEYFVKFENNGEFVEMMYRTFLGREADAKGKAYWQEILDYSHTREHVYNGFLGSAEFAAQCAKAYMYVGPEIATIDDSFEWKYNIEVLRLCNIEREKQGLTKLATRDDLWIAAMIRTTELPTLFSHTRPDGRSCFTVMRDMGMGYSSAAENIAAGYDSPAEVVNGWMNSSGHRANILGGCTYVATGVVYANDRYGIYWSQNFMSDRSDWYY